MTHPAASLEPLTFGSLFAGIGGLDLGLERAGMSCAWQVEIDDYATKVLTKHWPDVPKFRDVREVGAHNLSAVDVICGGFPCQDISYAGKGAGLAGERSGLWYEFARIIRELRPRYVLVENVAALLARGLDAVLGTLASLGYDAEWECLSAAAVGAPHLRKRIFLVAYPECKRRERRGDAGDLVGAVREARDKRESHSRGPAADDRSADVADADSERKLQSQGTIQNIGRRTGDGGNAHAADSDRNDAQGFECPSHDAEEWPLATARPIGLRDRARHWETEPAVGRLADGISSRVHRLRGLGNAVVPQCAEYVGRLIVEHANRVAA